MCTLSAADALLSSHCGHVFCLHLSVHVPGTHKQPAREILVVQPQIEPGWLQDAVRGGQSAALCA